MPTPLPPKIQFSHIPTMGDNAARGLRLSASAVTAPQVTSVVNAAKVAPAEVPKRISLPSRLPGAGLPAGPEQQARSLQFFRRAQWRLELDTFALQDGPSNLDWVSECQ